MVRINFMLYVPVVCFVGRICADRNLVLEVLTFPIYNRDALIHFDGSKFKEFEDNITSKFQVKNIAQIVVICLRFLYS
jgi:hypothetical protein